MKISASDPDIETLVLRIRRDELNLRPDFQRGEVWSEGKRQKLIDTILRGWQVPPIHVVSIPGTSELEVLDGQQRLAAIRDFSSDSFRFNGRIKPVASELASLDGRVFGAFPPQLQRRFNQYPLRVFTITDYQPDEPYELFYRLNQPTTLTAAEQRNAFFGKAREQVKGLVALAQGCGVDRESIGFSNARMAYDDVLARACMYCEGGTFHLHVTAASLNDRYRSNRPFESESLRQVENAIRIFALGRATYGESVRLNKASLLSWLLFFANNQAVWGNGEIAARIIAHFEMNRLRSGPTQSLDEFVERQWMALFDDRASSRVNDTLSVAARDFVLWFFFVHSGIPPVESTAKFRKMLDFADEIRRGTSNDRFIHPERYVQNALDLRRWDLRQ